MEKLNFAIVPRALDDDRLIAEMEVEHSCTVNVFESPSILYWFFRWGVYVYVDEGLVAEVSRQIDVRKVVVRNDKGETVAMVNINICHVQIEDQYSKESDIWFPVGTETKSTWILRPGGICIVLGPRLALQEPARESPYRDRMFHFFPKRA